MTLKGERSRARSKFLALALEAYASLHESEVELLKEYAVLDEDGNPKAAEDGSYTLREDAKGYREEREKLFREVAEIEGGTYTAHLSLMRQILADYDGDLSGDNADLYDALLDAFDTASPPETEKGENTDAK
jgi:hypothetical protein